VAASEVVPEEANPYSVISDRNVFHLNPPPPPPAAEAPKPADLPKIMLTGFVGKGSSMKVLLAIPPSRDTKESITYLSLSLGDREHDVQLVKIHLDKEEVEIMNSGTAQTLSAKSNSYAALAASSRPAAAPPGEKGVPGIHRSMNAGFAPPAGPSGPVAGTQGGGSPLIIGGGGESGSSLSRSAGGAIISGGSGGSSMGAAGGAAPGQYVPTGMTANSAAGTANNAGAQIPNTLFNPQTPRGQTAVPNVPLIPPDLQGPAMVLHKAALGGPPLLPVLQQELDTANGQEPPPPAPPGE
jgi:hypothetical protein